METTTENSLVLIVEQSGLEKTKGQILLDKFSGYFEQAAEIEAKLNLLTEDNHKEAGEIRKALKSSRVEAEKVRKELKESSLREGQTIDAIGRIIKNLIEPLEDKAEKIEKAKEIKAAQEKENRKIERLTKLAIYNVAAEPNIIADMTEEMFESYLAGVDKDYQAKLEADRKAEEERIAKEKKEAEEREAQRLENIRLKEEAEAKAEIRKKRNEELRPYIVFIRDYNTMLDMEEEVYQKELVDIKKGAELQWEHDRKEEARIAQEKIDAEGKLKAEKEAREKVERELKLKQELEAKEKREKEEKDAAEKAQQEEMHRLAALAPKKEKLSTWVNDFSITFPVGLDNDKTAKEIIEKFHSFKNWALEQVKNIK